MSFQGWKIQSAFKFMKPRTDKLMLCPLNLVLSRQCIIWSTLRSISSIPSLLQEWLLEMFWDFYAMLKSLSRLLSVIIRMFIIANLAILPPLRQKFIVLPRIRLSYSFKCTFITSLSLSEIMSTIVNSFLTLVAV